VKRTAKRSVGRPALIGALAVAAAAAWFGADTAPYPYAQRWLLDLPLPFLTNRRLDALLNARPGERVLEVGPGTGLQALHVADRLGAAGRLDIVDVQQPMLDHVMHRAAARKIGSIVPTRADARELPFDDGSFDAAYLVTVLGEIPDPAAAMREIRRVLKLGGRLVVGEFLDRHFVPLVTLLGYANGAGLRPSAWLGPPLAYFASFSRPPAMSDDGTAVEHLSSNLNGRRGHGDDGAVFVQEFAGQEADVAAAPHDATTPEQATRPGRPQKLDVQVGRGSEVAGTEAGC
jgi:SAM-dependent methyltransferase